MDEEETPQRSPFDLALDNWMLPYAIVSGSRDTVMAHEAAPVTMLHYEMKPGTVKLPAGLEDVDHIFIGHSPIYLN